MLDARSRWVVFQAFNVEPKLSDVQFSFKFKEILLCMKDAVDSEEGIVKYFKNKSIALRIKEIIIDIENKCAILLFVYIYKNVSDPAFGHFQRQQIRTEPKLDGEGIAVSFHYVISFRNVPNLGRLALKEKIQGLQSYFITSLLKDCFKQYGETESDTEKNIVSYPKLSIETLFSQKLIDDVEGKGVISGIQLIKRLSLSKIDERAETKEYVNKMSLKLHKMSGKESLGTVERIIQNTKDKFNESLLTIKRKEGKTYTIRTQADPNAIKELYYGKTEKITVSSPLPQCSDSIRQDIAQKNEGAFAF